MNLHANFRLVNRVAIEAEIERLIAILDLADGDCDLEDDDPAGGAVDDAGEDEPWRPDGATLPLPVYAVDQTSGPINEREAIQLWRAEAMALVRSPTGGWRHPN